MSTKTARFYLHIGPPKTATTSLQYAFQDLSCQSIKYVGTHQPRVGNGRDLSEILHGHCNRDYPLNAAQLSSIRNSIEEDLASGTSLLLSEEMFLVGQHKAPVATKIERLAGALEGIPTVIFLTIRRPSDALPSLYQELYPTLSRPERDDFSAFCAGPRAICFRYDKVSEMLRDAGFDDVRFVPFENLTSLGDVLDDESFARLTIPMQNTSRRNGGSGMRALPRVTVESSIRERKGLMAEIGRRIIRTLPAAVSAKVRNIGLSREQERDLVVPTALAEELDGQYEKAKSRAAGLTGRQP